MQSIVNIQMNLYAILISLILLLHHHKKKKSDVLGKRSFHILIICTCFGACVDSAIWILIGKDFPGARVVTTFLINFFYSMQTILFIVILIYCIQMNRIRIRKWLVFLMLISFIISFAMVIINIFYPFLFIVDESNDYHRLSMFYITGIMIGGYILASFILCILKYIQASKVDRKQCGYLIMFTLTPLIGISLQFLIYGLKTAWMMITIGIVYLYINVQSRREDKIEQELLEARISIMMSQIQPHFLFNSISVIQALCKSDPEKAKDALGNFAIFLRSNMNSLTSSNLISFVEELKHVESYLKLEKLRFQDKLTVIYDIEIMDFYLPSLTVQPIVENAVRHGISNSEKPGTVMICTQKLENRIIISVMDSGKGFDTKLNSNQVTNEHMGIHNVRERVRNMCDGELYIQSELDKGTSVQIILRKYGYTQT